VGAHGMKKLEAQEICKTYRRRRVVDDVSLVVWQGEVVGLLGPSGAGKTTVLKIVAGQIRPESGSVVQNDPAFMLMDDPFAALARLRLSRIVCTSWTAVSSGAALPQGWASGMSKLEMKEISKTNRGRGVAGPHE